MFKNKDFNSSLPYFRKYAVPGPRFDLSCLHPDLIAKMNSNSNTANEDGGELLQKENEESHRRFEDLKSILPSEAQISPTGYINLNGKAVNEEVVYKIIAKRFHTCLKEEKGKMKKEDLNKISDWDLVHNVCAFERLTLFNFFKASNPGAGDEQMKNLIFEEYMYYFDRKNLNIYRGPYQKIKQVFDIELS